MQMRSLLPNLTSVGRPIRKRVVSLTSALIDKNVEQAINACKPEARSLLQNREHMETIKEALNEGYCDISGFAIDLALVGE
jgi:ATP-dependent Zn protease